MTAIVGNAGVIQINGASVAEVRSYSIEMTADTIENTVMGDGSRQYVKGLSTFSGTADVYWHADHFTGTNNLDGELAAAVGDSGTTLIVYPQAPTVGTTDPVWGGNIIITGYSINASFDGMIEASVSFQGTGQLTYTLNG
jgi:predicted secreted protein